MRKVLPFLRQLAQLQYAAHPEKVVYVRNFDLRNSCTTIQHM